jgi:hypothetical protein
MKDQTVATQILKMASNLAQPTVATTAKRSLAASKRDFRECLALISAEPKTASFRTSATLPREITEAFPGMAKMQSAAHLKAIAAARTELAVMEKEYEQQLKKMASLKEIDASSSKILKEAAGQMKEKGRYLMETEDALVEFTAYMKTARPGIMQMIKGVEDVELGEKAGGMIDRIAAKLGQDVADAVEAIYEETYKDLSDAKMALKGFKVVVKTAGLRTVVKEAKLKEAGISDYVLIVKEWLSGVADSATSRVMNFAGDIKRWVAGFILRTKIVKKNKDTVVKSVDNFIKQMDKILA